jgi:phosphoribosylanthranilate isomerase
MEATAHPRVKICCIGSLEEARLAIELGASAIGLVSEMPSGPGVISEAKITEIAAQVPPAVASFLLTSRQNVEEIVAQQQRCRTNTVQLCDRLEPGAHAELRFRLPGIALVQVIHVTDEESIVDAEEVADDVDAILLDSGNLRQPDKELGGTGRTHDWEISRRIRELVNVPVFLAGGLTPENVAEAIRAVRPFAVDVCSGVREDGVLDSHLVSAFIATVQSA